MQKQLVLVVYMLQYLITRTIYRHEPDSLLILLSLVETNKRKQQIGMT